MFYRNTAVLHAEEPRTTGNLNLIQFLNLHFYLFSNLVQQLSGKTFEYYNVLHVLQM